jgi:hypothetical protein
MCSPTCDPVSSGGSASFGDGSYVNIFTGERVPDFDASPNEFASGLCIGSPDTGSLLSGLYPDEGPPPVAQPQLVCGGLSFFGFPGNVNEGVLSGSGCSHPVTRVLVNPLGSPHIYQQCYAGPTNPVCLITSDGGIDFPLDPTSAFQLNARSDNPLASGAVITGTVFPQDPGVTPQTFTAELN